MQEVEQRRSSCRKSPKDGPQDVGQFAASTRRCCQQTPELARAPEAQGLCARRVRGVAFSLLRAPALRPSGRLRRSRCSCSAVVTFLLATQEKVGRSPKASESLLGMPHKSRKCYARSSACESCSASAPCVAIHVHVLRREHKMPWSDLWIPCDQRGCADSIHAVISRAISRRDKSTHRQRSSALRLTCAGVS